MVKKFTANCDFGGKKSPVTLYVGDPAAGTHPLNFQNKWLSDTKGGSVPSDIMDSFSKLIEIAAKNRVSFEELCAYVIDELKSSSTIADDAKQATAVSSVDQKNEKKIEESSTKTTTSSDKKDESEDEKK